MMMEKYSAALRNPNEYGHLPLHVECSIRCRSAIILKCIELYSEALADAQGYLLLHRLLDNESSSIKDALMMMMEKYSLPWKIIFRCIKCWISRHHPSLTRY
jgi:hypothetical protein